MESHISATEAVRTFSDLMNRVRYRGESFVVERGGEPICRISPAGASVVTLRNLAALLSKAPRPDKRFLDQLERLSRKQPSVPKGPWER